MESDSQTGTNAPWKPVQPYLRQGFEEAQSLYEQGPNQFYPGQTYIDADPLEHQANTQRLDYAQNQLPGQINATQGAQLSMLNAPDIDNNPYVQTLMQRVNQRIGQDFNETVMPGIRSNSIQAMNLGGSRQGIAEGVAAGRAADAMADATARLGSEAYNAGLNQQYRGVTTAPQVAQLGFMPADTMGQAGQFLRGQAELALGDDIQRFNFQQNAPWDNLARYGQSLQGGLQYTPGQTSMTQPSNTFGNVMGGALVGNELFGGTLGTIGGGLLGGLL